MAAQLPKGKDMVVVAVLAVIVIYFFGLLMPKVDYTCKPTDLDDLATADEDESNYGCTAVDDVVQRREFNVPSQSTLEGSTFWVLKLIMAVAFVYLSIFVFNYFSKHSFGRKDIIFLVIMGVAVILVYRYLLQPVLGVNTFDAITWKFAKMTKLLP